MARHDQSVTDGGNIPVVNTIDSYVAPGPEIFGPSAEFADAMQALLLEGGAGDGTPATAGLRLVARSLPIIIWGVGPDRCLSECFGGGLARLGVADDELVGVPVGVFGQPAADWTEELFRGEAGSMLIEGEGTNGPFRFHAVAAPAPSMGGYVAVAIDVTEQANAERIAAHEELLHRTAMEALRGSEARFETVTEHVPIGVFLADVDGVLTYANPEVMRILDRNWTDFDTDRSLHDLVHPDDIAAVTSALDEYRQTRESRIFECRAMRADGEEVQVRVRLVTVFGKDGEATGIVGSIADISDFVAADAKLREREERTRAILETAGEAIVSCAEDGTILEFNAAAARMFGFEADEVIGRRKWAEFIPQPQRNYFEQRFADYITGGAPKFVGQGVFELPGLRKDGTHVPMEAAITEVRAGTQRIFTTVMRDLTERKVLERELERLSTHDDLTGLPNRVLLFGQLESALARAHRHRTSVAVLFIDIDRFKLVTESLGHRAGDELIVQVARRLERAVPEGSSITRFSSDQFVVYLEDIEDISDAVDVATAVVDAVNDPFEVAGDEAFVGATVGIAFALQGMSTAETLVSNADVAMSRAKDHSVTRYEVFDAEMRAKVDAQRRLEIAMRHGIDREEFELHYQPVVSLDSGEVHGVEALVRWNHPRLGFLPPAEFIPVAEDSGLILRLGQWILEEACRQQATWARKYPDRPLTVSVNLSGRQLTQPGLAEILRSAIARTGADPHMIACEITETMILDDVEAAGATLHELKSIGVRLALDDFGTGYSSLTYLCRFPIDILKVDRSFVSQLGTATPDSTIVEMVVNLARTMQLEVVAEGVETDRQARLLKAIGCPLAQGYLFSRPVTVDEIEKQVMGLDLDGLAGMAADAEVVEPGLAGSDEDVVDLTHGPQR